MNINKLFTDKQYGFMSGRSTSLQLLAVLDKWTEVLDSGSTIDCIYMDFRAAFDTVPHKRLISKLQAYGLSTQIIQWITSFLDSRVQRVDINGQTSDWKNVTSGIPQGSVLGPILFVMFINDLPDLIKSEVFLFADDTKVFSVNKSVKDAEQLQSDLDALEEWSNKWLLNSTLISAKNSTLVNQVYVQARLTR